MQYITGSHALNLSCKLDTCGDWHTSALRWKNIHFEETETMFFKNYGLEFERKIPNSDKTYVVANHIRALLDLLELRKYSVAQGMNEDFICNPRYDQEVFEKVYSMRAIKHWDEIDRFMKKEYKTKWLKYKEMCNNE